MYVVSAATTLLPSIIMIGNVQKITDDSILFIFHLCCLLFPFSPVLWGSFKGDKTALIINPIYALHSHWPCNFRTILISDTIFFNF